METPIEGVKQLLAKTNMSIKDIYLFEHNEAFAAASYAIKNLLKVSNEKFNVNGWAFALSYPLGCSGSQILVTFYHELVKQGGYKGVASICLGGGEAITMLIES